MGFLKHYTIEWFNALTGAAIFSENQFTNLSGELLMQFPLLTGDDLQPIIFFRVYPFNESSFKSLETDTTNEKIEVESIINSNDSSYNHVLTNWDNLDTSNGSLVISVTPNPTSGEIIVSCNVEQFEGAIWQLTSENGEILISGIISEQIFTINLTPYSKGVYYLNTIIDNQKYVKKIIKV